MDLAGALVYLPSLVTKASLMIVDISFKPRFPHNTQPCHVALHARKKCQFRSNSAKKEAWRVRVCCLDSDAGCSPAGEAADGRELSCATARSDFAFLLYCFFFLPRRGYLETEPTSAPSNRTKKTKPDVDFLVRPPRTGVHAASGVRGLGMEEVVVLEVRTRVATRTRGAGGG